MDIVCQTWLVFRLHGALFAVDALAVCQVLPLPGLAAVEETPPYVVGVINLHGRIVPVLDLNLRFGHPTCPPSLEDALIVLDIEGLQAAFIVSEALEVVTIPPSEVVPPPLPERPERLFPPFVLGHAQLGDDLVLILDHRLLALWVEDCSWLPEVLPGAPEAGKAGASCLPRTTAQDSVDREFRRRALAQQAVPEGIGDADRPQVVVVEIGGEFFGLDAKQVRTFTALESFTPVPNCPSHIAGIMNLRGRVLTLLDLRELLGLSRPMLSPVARVAVISAAGRSAGIVVEHVHELLEFRPADLEALPTTVDSGAKAVTRGVLSREGRPVTLLDLELLFADERLVVTAGASQEGLTKKATPSH